MKHLIFLAAASLAFCQNSVAPLAVQMQPPTTTAKNLMLPVSCNNVSGKSVAAYVFIVDSLDANGKQVFREVHTGMPGLNPKHPEATKAAGATWTENLKLANLSQTVAKRTITLDYVLFADGGGDWGPDNLKYSLKIAGFKEGLAVQAHNP